jgi:integrase/recombinase XerD
MWKMFTPMFTPFHFNSLDCTVFNKESKMATVSIVYRKDKINNKGKAPIHLRIIKNRKISYIATGYMIPEENWDSVNNKVDKKYPNSVRINNHIFQRYAELNDTVISLETENKTLTNRQLKNQVIGSKPSDFFEFANKVLENYLLDGQIGTYDRCKSVIHKLNKYTSGQSLTFNEITPEYLAKYEKYLKTKQGNSINTVHSNFKFIRKVFNDAINQDLVSLNSNPFLKFKMKVEKTSREFLSEDELKLIENYQATPGTRLELHKDMFVFSAYTGGIRVSDLLQMQWKDFDGEKIKFIIKKTGTQISIKVPAKALKIIEKYKPKKPKSDSFLFPALSPDIDLTNAYEIDKAISGTTAYINKNLKIIANKIELEKKLSFHISRHTWATRALTMGISIDKVSKLMGHSNLKETQIYAKIINKSLDDAMDLFN